MDFNKKIISSLSLPAFNASIFSEKQTAGAEPMGKNQYSSNIDTMRAVAVFGVVAHHIGAFTGFHVYFFSGIGALFGVQLFFIISGYLISGSANKFALSTYAIHRILRVFPAYLFAFIGIGMATGILSAANILQRPGSFLLSLMNLQQLYPVALLELDVLHVSWTLTVEMIWYLLAPILMIAYRRWAWLTFVILVAMSMLWSFAASRNLLDGLYSGGFSALALPPQPGQSDIIIKYAFPVQFMFFGIGALIFRYKNKIDGISASWLLLVIFGSTVMYDHYINSVPLYSIFTGLGPTAFFLLMMKARPLDLPFIEYLGKISYSIYLLHFPIIIWCAKQFGFLGSYHLLITVALIILLSHLMFKFVEHPCMQYAKRFQKLKA